ncbi:MAG: hypothetical protein AAFN13_15740 [Bacteroidota bacterium]
MSRLSLVALLLLAFLIPATVFAQDTDHERPHLGLSGIVQGADLAVGLPVWVGPTLKLEPLVAVSYGSDIGTDLGVGLVARSYFSPKGTAGYVGARLVGFFAFPDSGELEDTGDFLIGAVLGGEHFLHKQFSLGVEAQLNLAISADQSARFGNPGGSVVNTGTAVYATFYF